MGNQKRVQVVSVLDPNNPDTRILMLADSRWHEPIPALGSWTDGDEARAAAGKVNAMPEREWSDYCTDRANE